jgi:microcystin-dependent protein
LLWWEFSLQEINSFKTTSMADQFLGEIRMFGCNYAPQGWAQCNGQLLSISQNTALFSLLGTQYGGDGRVNFALPNLQGASTLNAGSGAGLSTYEVGESGGQATVTLSPSQMPMHSHSVNAVTAGNTADPNGLLWGNPAGRPAPFFYANSIGTAVAMSTQAIGLSGGNGPHDNLMPYLVINVCIALTGIFPARS